MSVASCRFQRCASTILGIAASHLAVWPAHLMAQDYPTKPVRVISTQAAGSVVDTAMRGVFAKISEALGQQFLIDNRPAAGGTIAGELVAKAPADGYTVLCSINTVMVVNPFLYAKLGYDPLRNFDALSTLVKISEVLIVHPSLGVKTVDELVRVAKARPKQIMYSSGGNGHPTHLMMELFQRKAGIQLVHVPYKGASPAVQAVVGGEVAALNIAIGLARPHLVTGKVLALAKTGLPAQDALPGVPALTTFYPDAEYIPWVAAFAPKGTPRPVIVKLNAALANALALQEVRTRLREMDLAAAPGTPSELEQVVRADMKVNRELVKSIGLRLD